MQKKLKLISLLIFCGSLNALAQFTAVSNSPVSTEELESKGVAWVDYDNDGDDDLFITTSSTQGISSSKDVLYKNNGDGSFTKIETGNLVTEDGTGRNSTWSDFNNDGLIDVFITNQHVTSLFKNAGGGVFNKIASVPTTGLSVDGDHSGADWGDYNGDGYVDLFLASYKLNDDAKNVLYLNNKDESFQEISNEIVSTTGSSMDPSWIDYDNNGTLDLFVPNYCSDNFLYANQGNGTFNNITSNALLSYNCSVGASWADYDNDGDFDVVIQNNVNQPSQFFENNSNGTFTEKINAVTSHTSSSAAWGDFDNDGFIDIVLVGSYPERKTYLYKNNGNKSFTDVSTQQGITNANYSWGVAWADYDKDGFLDFFITNAHAESPFLPNDILYHNTPNANGWINIKLKGTNYNHSSIGARVKIKAQGKWQMRTVQSKTGNNSQNSLNIHFGIGSAENIDTLQVIWPNNGYQEFLNQGKNQFIEIIEIDFPKAPTGLTAISSNSGEVDLSWTDNSSDETGFRLERSKGNANNFKPVAAVSKNTTSFTDQELQVSTTYYYRIASTTNEGFSMYSNIAEVEVGAGTITGIGDQEGPVFVYPNPVDDYLIMSCKSPTPFKIVNITGQTVYSGVCMENNPVTSFKYFPSGLYVLSIGNKKYKVIKR